MKKKIWIIMLSVKYDKWNENFNLLCFSSRICIRTYTHILKSYEVNETYTENDNSLWKPVRIKKNLKCLLKHDELDVCVCVCLLY